MAIASPSHRHEERDGPRAAPSGPRSREGRAQSVAASIHGTVRGSMRFRSSFLRSRRERPPWGRPHASPRTREKRPHGVARPPWPPRSKRTAPATRKVAPCAFDAPLDEPGKDPVDPTLTENASRVLADRYHSVVEARRALAVAVLAAASIPFGCAPRSPELPPVEPAASAPSRSGPERVLLVTIDTLRADHVGAYGARGARTRTLDALAKRGVRFETAIAPTPLTLPSHSSLLTGLEPDALGVHANAIFRLEDGIPTLAEGFRAGGFATAGFVSSVVLDRSYGVARGFEDYDDAMGFRRTTPGGGLAERTADQVVDAVLAWLDAAPERFFLWVHFYDPHADYAPPAAYQPDPARIPRPPPDASFYEKTTTAMRPFYAAEIAFADAELGRLLDALEARFPNGDTLVAVTSDHGESLGEHGELTHTLSVYDATQHVPLILAGGGLPAGRVVAAPVRLIDVAPTLLAAAGLPPLPETDGVDLHPWIRGERSDGLDAYVETLATRVDYGWSPVLGLRTPTVKYLRVPRPELYDLAADPAELDNLAASDPARVAELDAALSARLADARPVRPQAPDQGDRALLESLGYVVPTPTEEFALGPVSGADPKDRMHAIVAMLEATSAVTVGDSKRALQILEGAPEAGGWIEQVRASAWLHEGKPERAERHARNAVAAQPGHPSGYLLLARALEDQGRADAARASYREAMEIDPTRSEATCALGRIAESEGDIEAAIAFYDEAAAARTPNAEAALRRAALYFESGQPYQARLLIEKAWDVEGIVVSARRRVIRAEAEAGYPERAMKRLQGIMGRPVESRALAPFYRDMVETYFPAGA
jgi:choline-sulfatase